MNGASALGAAAAIVADRIIGEPPARVHPVAAFGRAMGIAEGPLYRDDRLAGTAYAAAGAAVAAATGFVLRRAIGTAAATFAAAETAIAGKMLADTAGLIQAALRDNDLAEARRLLPSLVGRNPSDLDEAAIARAVVESVAENTVDAVVAPALWAGALGAPGVLAHRAVNTLDSMVGHRSERYARFGWASARLDDAAAWLPARVTALLVVVVRPATGAAVWRAVRHDAPAHPSPNAGVAEAAFAAALGLQFGGVNHYGDRFEARARLGTGRPPSVADIDAAVALARDVGWALATALAALGAAAMVVGRRRHRR